MVRRSSWATTLLAGLAWLGACSRCATTPSTAECRLLGTWEVDMTRDPRLARLVERRGGDLTEMVERLRGETRLPRMTFEATGGYVSEGEVLGHFVRDEASWRLVEEAGDRITIEIESAGHPAELWSFTVLGVDLIRPEFPSGPGLYHRRVE